MSTAISVCHGAFGRAALYSLNKSLITHAHREGHLLFNIDGATSDVTVSDSTYTLDETYAAAVSPLEPHSFDVQGTEPSLLLILYVKPIWFLENSQSAQHTLQFGGTSVVRTPSIDDLVKRFTSLLLDIENADNVDALLFNLTKQCYEQTWSKVPETNSVQSRCSRFNDFRIRRSLRLMQQHNSADMEMEQVARSVGLSRPHFFKLFKKQLGITPNVYLNTLRSERAIDELVNTEKTVTNIAYDLGYSSQASFTRFFLSNVGIAPSEYRRVADRPHAPFPI